MDKNQTADQSKIRIQFEDFQLDNFDIATIWEFAIDEEGEDGQDETTLRPLLNATIADPADGLCIVKAEFITARGKTYYGLCSPAFEYNLSEIQPYMITENGAITFWFGMLEPDKTSIEHIYKQLGETKETLFPIKFKALTPTKGAKLVGQLDGFLWKPISGEEVFIIK